MTGVTRAAALAEIAKRPSGATTPELAAHFGCRSSTVSAILGDLWRLQKIERIVAGRDSRNVYVLPGTRIDGLPEPERGMPKDKGEGERMMAAIVELVASRPDGITTAEIAERMGIKANRAGLYLGRLRDRGRVYGDENGRRGVTWRPGADEDLAMDVPTMDPEAMWRRAAEAGLRLYV